jgi:hypothetical protein
MQLPMPLAADAATAATAAVAAGGGPPRDVAPGRQCPPSFSVRPLLPLMLPLLVMLPLMLPGPQLRLPGVPLPVHLLLLLLLRYRCTVCWMTRRAPVHGVVAHVPSSSGSVRGAPRGSHRQSRAPVPCHLEMVCCGVPALRHSASSFSLPLALFQSDSLRAPTRGVASRVGITPSAGLGLCTPSDVAFARWSSASQNERNQNHEFLLPAKPTDR